MKISSVFDYFISFYALMTDTDEVLSSMVKRETLEGADMAANTFYSYLHRDVGSWAVDAHNHFIYPCSRN